MMQLLSYFTVTIGGQTVTYKLYKDPKEKKYHFKTQELTLRHPDFSAWRESGEWVFENLKDEWLRGQAIAEITELRKMNNFPIL